MGYYRAVTLNGAAVWATVAHLDMSSHSQRSWPVWPMAPGVACYHSVYVSTYTHIHLHTCITRHTHVLPVIILYPPLVTIGWKVFLCPWVRLSLKWDCVCVQPSFAGTPVPQLVVSERDEVSSTSQKCPSLVPHLSYWSAQRPDFVKVMVPGAARSHAALVSLIICVHNSNSLQNSDLKSQNNDMIPQWLSIKKILTDPK